MKSSAPTGRRNTAQGEALGNGGTSRQALKGRNTRVTITPFQGLRRFAALHPGLYSAAPLGQRPNAMATTLRVSMVCLCLTLTALACGWFGPVNSIRFNDYLSGHDFFRLPPLPKAINGATGRPYRWYEQFGNEGNYDEMERHRQQREKRIAALWETAAAAEAQGDWRLMWQSLEQYLELNVRTEGWSNESDLQRQARRNSAADRLDALASLTQGASGKGVRAYLAARSRYDAALIDGEAHAIAVDIEEKIAEVPREPALRDNAAYLSAAYQYRSKSYAAAEQNFLRLATQYSHSEKREAALLMGGLSALKQSSCYIDEYGLPKESGCNDELWQRARQTFARQIAQYPHGRLAADARGWLGYLARGSGDSAGAMIEYYRQLADDDASVRRDAAFSLSFMRGDATDADLARVEAELADEPQAALAYSYHNLYNYAYAVEPGAWGWNEVDWANAKKAKAYDARQRIVDYAARMAQRHAGASGAFLLRIAQAKLELEEPRDALTLVGRALKSGLPDEERKQALWVKGAAEYYLEDFASARLTLKALIAADANRDLTHGARRMLAIVAEKQSDWGEALAQYYALGYDTDVAYLLDVIMTPEQIAHFIQKRATSEQRNDLQYALGLRWLRVGRWAEARAVLTVVTAVACAMPDRSYDWQLQRPGKQRPKFDLEIPAQGICSQWLLRDLKTIDDLETLEARVATAVNDEARAEALYQLASYQYDSSTEIFYNPRLWQSQRHWLLGSLAEKESYLVPNEARRLWDYMNSHDVLARALPIYLDIAERYPNSKAAGDALFTAAMCHERLSDMNRYWRTSYDNGLYAGAKLVTFRDVRRAFPKYRFPRGTMGWEPMTRTVNGGPAWDALPKPGPPLTRTQRWQIRLKRIHRILDTAVVQRADAMLNGYVKPYYRWWATTLSDGLNEWIAAVLMGWLTLACVETYNRRLALSFGADWLLDLQLRQQPLEGLGLNLLGVEKRDDSKTPVERIIDDS